MAWVSSLTLLLPTSLVLAVLPAAPAAAADTPPFITLAKEGPGQILVGDPATYTLTASNPAGTGQIPQYNLSFRDQLPPGLTYTGPTTPSGAGEPKVVTVKPSADDESTWYQVLTWDNVADLQVGSSSSLSFTVQADKTPWPVSSSFVNNANAYTNADARYVPKFDGNGNVVDGSYTEAASAASAATGVTAFRIEKSSAPSPEGELLRGIHDHVATYTLEVTNNPSFATDDITIVDYLPAGLEFLGCGGVDNSTDTDLYPDGREYPSAPSLTATPTVDDCVAAQSVDTVELADGNAAGLSAGVYTQVTWSLGDFAAGDVRSIVYRAGIPQRRNTLTWQGETPDTDGAQTANLDNNTGSSTRETDTEQTLTNGVVGSGSYTGPVPGQPTPTPITSTTTHTVTAEDLAMQKSVSPTTFNAGAIATYTLDVQTSEYVTASGVVIADTLPNGVCPVWGSQTPTVSGAIAMPAECGAGKGADPTDATLQTVESKSDGTFVLTFAPATLPKNATARVTYQALMRTEYTGGDLAGKPTSAGDSFTNQVAVTGSTSSAEGVNPPPNPGEATDPITVHDDSSATQTSTEPTIDKRMKPNVSGADGYQCDQGTGDFQPGAPVSKDGADEYLDAPTPPLSAEQARSITFRNGSVVCFLLHVQFPSQSQTRNPAITDFLPANTSYVAGSMVATANNTTVLTADQFAVDDNVLTWVPGTAKESSYFVEKGDVFEIVFAVRINGAAEGNTPDLVGNLMKLRSENSAGQAISLRDQLDFRIAPLPPVSLVKGIASITSAGTTTDVNQPPSASTNQDGRPVHAGDVVKFRIDVTNDADDLGQASQSSVRGLDIWDLLPAGVRCANVADPDPVGSPPAVSFACLDPGQPDYPSSLVSGLSLVRWLFDSSDTHAIAVGATKTLTYDFTVPADASVGAIYTNTAGVRSYQAWTNVRNEAVTYYPTANIDPGACGSGTLPACEAPAATDPSHVTVPDVVLAKTATTSITEGGNNELSEATIGELVTYTLTATVPHGTSVYRGVLTDTLPNGLAFVSATAEHSTDAGGTWGAVPAGTSGPTQGTDPQVVTLGLPPSYTDAAAATQDHVFRMTVTARVTQDGANRHGLVLTNVATFASKLADSDTAGDATPPPSATYPVTVVEPSPTLAKAADPSTDLVAGQTVTYTLTASNASSRPPMHNSWMVDCLPDGLVFVGYQTHDGPIVAAEPGTGTGSGGNGCEAGLTRLAWQPTSAGAAHDGTLLGGTTATLTYTATISTESAGLTPYTNLANLTGGTLYDASQTSPQSPPNADERTYTAPASATVTVKGGTVTKSVAPTSATIGQTATWTIHETLPADVNFYQASVIDQVERGIDMDSVQTVSVTCEPGCTLTGTPLTPAAGPGTSTLIGWYLGDISAATADRTVTIVYTAKVANLDNATTPKRGDALLDAATLKWDTVNRPDAPTSADAVFERSSAPATATLTVLEPLVTIAKRMSPTTTPAPGDVFTYTVTVSNSSAANVSTAFNVAVQDVVPAQVVVQTIDQDGKISGNDATTGGGTITWPTITSLEPGHSVTYTYTAKLAPSANLTASAKTNTASVTGYDSLATGGRHYTGPTARATVTPALPQVTPSKTTPNGPVAYINAPFTWQITLTNTGTSRAYGVDGVDTLPPNWAFTAVSSITVAGTALNPAPAPVLSGPDNRTLTWTDLGGINAGQTIVITFTATPSSAAATANGSATAHTNSVATTAEDATGEQGSASGPYNTGPQTAVARIHAADLVLDKGHTGTPVAGSSFDWTITVTNNGPDTAVGPFTVTDTIASPMSLVSAGGTGWTCTTNGADLSCHRSNPANTLANGASFDVITVRVTVPSDTAAGTVLSNSATVAGKTYDPDLVNNSDTDSATLTAQADLGIVKRLSGSLVAGHDATYTLDVTNYGPSTSRATISVTDVVPAGTTFVTASGEGWDCPEDSDPVVSTMTCTRDTDLAAGAAAGQITVVLHVDADFLGTATTRDLSNTATVAGTTPDPNGSNDSSTETKPVTGLADMAIIKTHDGPFTPGTTDNSYTFTVHNYGPSDAASPVTVTDELPAYLSWTGTKTDVTGTWSCSADPTGAPTAPDRQTITCTLSGALAPGQTREVRVDIAVAADAGENGSFSNTATVGSGTPDPNPANNTWTVGTEFDAIADLAIAKTPATQGAVAGNQVTWSVTVSNKGPSDSIGPTTVTDVLPAGTSVVSASGSGWNDCTVVGRAITCVYPDGVPAESGRNALPPIVVVATIAPSAGPAILTNITSVTAPTQDSDITNNADSANVVVRDEADLSIVKTFTGTDPVAAGDTTTFSLQVANAGASDADNVVVSDELPAGLSLESVAGDGWTCDSVGQLVTCTRPSLPATAPLPTPAPVITLTVRVASGFLGASIENTAHVSAGTQDPDMSNNESADDFTVRVSADLVLEKSHAKDVVAIAGQPFTFDIAVRNAGPSDAQAPIVVADRLPAGLSYVSNGPDWTCTTSGTPAVDEVVECTLDGDGALIATLPAPVLTLTTLIAADADPGRLINAATVTSPTPDPDTHNNTDTDSIDVTTLADLVVTKAHAGPVSVGQDLVFALGVTNDGPSEARSVRLVDTLPKGLTYVAATGTDWTCVADGQKVTCDLAGPLAPKATAPAVTLAVTVGAAAYPKVDNVVVGSTDTPESSTSNNTATDPVTVPPLVDLAVDKAHTGDFTVGTNGTYVLTVSNHGPTSDPGPQTITDTLPAGLTFVSGTGQDWACTASGATVTCVRKAALDVDATTAVTLVVSVGPAAAPSVVNTATVATPSTESATANNTDSDVTTVIPVSVLTIDKSATDVSGDQATYEITVTNTGPNATTRPIVVVDPMPDGLEFVSVSGDGWDCSGGQAVTCTYAASLAVGGSAAFELVATITADPEAEVVNVATVVAGSEGQPSDDAVVIAPASDEGGGADSGDDLAATGADVASLLIVALLFLVVGSAAVVRSRRER